MHVPNNSPPFPFPFQLCLKCLLASKNPFWSIFASRTCESNLALTVCKTCHRSRRGLRIRVRPQWLRHRQPPLWIAGFWSRMRPQLPERHQPWTLGPPQFHVDRIWSSSSKPIPPESRAFGIKRQFPRLHVSEYRIRKGQATPRRKLPLLQT